MEPEAALEGLLHRLESRGVRLGLDRVRQVLDRFGRPERRVPSVLVGGTNGKGSTASVLAAIATAAGYRTGIYTSPHLERVEERLQVDGRPIPGAELASILAEVLADVARAGGEPPTYFEALTLAAFVWFDRQRLDLAVYEVGLGGRLDATNVVDPELSLVTSIDLDHQVELGSSLASIATEKAGILRAGRPALASVETPEARRALETEARRVGADLRFVSDGLAQLHLEQEQAERQWFTLDTPVGSYALDCPLVGAHQRSNVTLAVLAAESLAARGWRQIDERAIRTGVATVRWPGRLESWLVGSSRVLVDGAHNPAAAEALARHLERVDYDLLFGAMRDKQVGAMLARLGAGARRVTLTAPVTPRAAPPEDLARLLDHPAVAVVPSVGPALREALALRPELLLVTGSLYLVGEARRALRRLVSARRRAS